MKQFLLPLNLNLNDNKILIFECIGKHHSYKLDPKIINRYIILFNTVYVMLFTWNEKGVEMVHTWLSIIVSNVKIFLDLDFPFPDPANAPKTFFLMHFAQLSAWNINLRHRATNIFQIYSFYIGKIFKNIKIRKSIFPRHSSNQPMELC